MDSKEIENLAALARIKLSDEEKTSLTQDLGRILAFVDELKEADVSNVGDRGESTPRNVMRDDGTAHESGKYTDALLENAPRRDGDYVNVKKIL